MDWLEIFTLVTGIAYIILEIRQKNLMWLVGIATSAAAMAVFWKGGLYASFALNMYYFCVSFWGLYRWRADSEKMRSHDGGKTGIHLNRLHLKTVVASAVIMAAGTVAAVSLLKLLNDPMSPLDASVAVLSAIATWWLGRAYISQWLLWIVADMLSAVLCATQGLYWMSALYAVYAASAVYGYVHWKRFGTYIG